MIKVKDLVAKYGEYEIDEKEIEKVLVKPKPKTVWELEPGDSCFIMDGDGTITDSKFDEYDDICDDRFRELGMVALTEQELIDFREWLKIRAELLKLGGREKFKPYEENWLIWCDHDHKEVVVNYSTIFQHTLIYFDTKEQAENAVKEIGEDRLKKYWFKVVE